ncbi:MAG: hypothetical protein CMJ76_08235 [Planctomycetaceae bacterium]|nr:hypothetical protein [Planctomycetaceae bacterium]
MNAMRSLIRIFAVYLISITQNAKAQQIEPLLEKYCADCHNSEEAQGQLDVVTLLQQKPLVRNLQQWRIVIDRIEGGEMPPEDAEQPNSKERDAILKVLTDNVDNFDYSTIRDPGYEPARRLSNIEYDNTVSDLFGTELSPSSKFPADLSGKSGFDNSANTLFLQPRLFERFVHAADEISNTILSNENGPLQNRLSISIGPQPTHALTSFLEDFLSRVFRRPATDQEKQRYRNLFVATYEKTNDRKMAYKKLIDTALISPQFLFKSEAVTTADEAYKIGHYDLANRLSYFLWASMPDAELFQLAEERMLFDKGVITEQIQRMLKSPKADTLGSIFGGQWLGFQHLGTRIRMDPIDNPWCTDTLMAAMREETSMLLNHAFRKNVSATELLLADYTFVNEELARHYRIPNVRGDNMRKINLTSPHRGGLLGQGSLLAVTSFPGRTSPIVRGNWVLTTVLGTPPPPPPPGAAEFEASIERRRDLSTSEKLALHRENQRCASCHDQIDPLGVALENFDFFGRYQTRSRGKSIDTQATLPDGTRFEGPAGLKLAIVGSYHEEFVKQLTRKLLSYALGRQLEYYDKPAIDSIYQQMQDNDYALHSLIEGIVHSYPFKNKLAPLLVSEVTNE